MKASCQVLEWGTRSCIARFAPFQPAQHQSGSALCTSLVSVLLNYPASQGRGKGSCCPLCICCSWLSLMFVPCVYAAVCCPSCIIFMFAPHLHLSFQFLFQVLLKPICPLISYTYGYNCYNGGWPSARLFGWSAADWSRPATNKSMSSETKRKSLLFCRERKSWTSWLLTCRSKKVAAKIYLWYYYCLIRIPTNITPFFVHSFVSDHNLFPCLFCLCSVCVYPEIP